MVKKRIVAILIVLGLIYGYSVYGVVSAGRNQEYLQAVNAQTGGTLNLTKSRGTIYDCNLQPMTNEDTEVLAVAIPTPQAIYEVSAYIDIDQEAAVKNGAPITFVTDKVFPSQYVDFFTIPKRYGEDSLAANIIGYVDSSGKGVTGAEKVFDDILCKPTGGITMHNTVDALGRIIVGADTTYENTLEETKSGIALTIDKNLQKKAEDIASVLKKGAVVVVSVPDCEVKASVSCPGYKQVNLEKDLKGENAPMVNRAFSAFAPGSVFKLVVATAALNTGADGKSNYTCTGSINVDGVNITCYGGKAHGKVNLHTALQKSCNCYFISLANRISPQTLCETALNMGLGTETILYQNYSSDSGIVPDPLSLDSRQKIANFSIGQGELTTTPLQIAAMINTIASDGVYTAPKLFKGEVTNEKEIIPGGQGAGSVSAMEASVALRLKSYMESTSKFGTAKEGAPEGVLTGAKTGTAQTGVFAGKDELLNYWYAGYVGKENKPEYAVVVLSEGAEPGMNQCPMVFKELGECLTSDEYRTER